MQYTCWNKDSFKLKYSNSSITSFRNRLIKNMDEVMYFYYDIEVLDGENVLFKESVYDCPKVNDLPDYIDFLIDKEESKMFVYEEYERDGFYRKKLYDFVTLEDMDVEYFYKIERIITYIKQRYDSDIKRYEEFILTIGKHAPNKKGFDNGEDFGQSVFIKYLSKEDILSLKYTAIEFCKMAIDNYNNNLKEYKIKCPKCNKHQLYLESLVSEDDSREVEFKCSSCGYQFDDNEDCFIE